MTLLFRSLSCMTLLSSPLSEHLRSEEYGFFWAGTRTELKDEGSPPGVDRNIPSLVGINCLLEELVGNSLEYYHSPAMMAVKKGRIHMGQILAETVHCCGMLVEQ